ncbi:hypothetical protein [Ornithinibacillus halotolerans]|uniref:DUF3679 domain-containing protein n=1 Tax=Ornithinibacillus halotolerans TaxID=1274357 RepID=A0A916W560_9BACI|nr:hypothetical protein [Ornithinibacillus halotolerans]GGA68788.1 hypothetical protein GCM10008025_10980 [Ornithinibacillus halotolerans]
MFKYISVILLLVIVFLVGTIIGAEHKGESILPTFKEENTTEKVTEEVTHTANTTEQKQEVVNEQMIAQELSMSNQDHLSQKTASFFEVIVQGFYDILVEILYQISQLFF